MRANFELVPPKPTPPEVEIVVRMTEAEARHVLAFFAPMVEGIPGDPRHFVRAVENALRSVDRAKESD